MDCSPLGSVCAWGFLGRYIRVGCHFLLHGISQNQGLNLHLFHQQAGSSPLSHWGKPPEDLGRHINKSYKMWIWKGYTVRKRVLFLPATNCCSLQRVESKKGELYVLGKADSLETLSARQHTPWSFNWSCFLSKERAGKEMEVCSPRLTLLGCISV